jgi:hypothetical protein
MHASIWRFVGDPDELTRSYDQLVAEFPTDGFVAHPCLRGGIARREVGPHVIAADDAEDLHFTGAWRRQPRIRIVAHPAFGQHEGSRRRHQTARAALVFANLGTRRVVRPSSRCGDRRRVLLWHERGYDAGADCAATSRLPIV